MKKVFYKFIDSNNHDIINQFGEEEDISIIVYDRNISSQSQSDNELSKYILFFITDDPDIDHSSMPPVRNCYVLNSIQSKTINNIRYFSVDLSLAMLRFILNDLYFTHSDYPSKNYVCNYFSSKYSLSNNLLHIEGFINSSTIALLNFISFREASRIRIALSEIIANAMEHGNLGITSAEKHITTENGTYDDLLSERVNDPFYANRRVLIDMIFSETEIYFKVEDEGDGFDVDAIDSPLDSDKIMNLHGRGILITRNCFTKVKYNFKGNSVELFYKI